MLFTIFRGSVCLFGEIFLTGEKTPAFLFGENVVTIEPVIDFDINGMVSWIENINPCMVWLGYDSGKNRLPEPELKKVKELYWQLGQRGFMVVLKKIRKAWNE